MALLSHITACLGLTFDVGGAILVIQRRASERHASQALFY